MKIKGIVSLLLSVLCCAAAHGQINQISLNSDSKNIEWRIKPQAEVNVSPNEMSGGSFDMASWVPAVVPGATFVSYVEAGLEQDPNWGDNAYKVDTSKYDRNFWYRGEFAVPQLKDGETLWLNFEGVNRKGEIWLNGHRLGMLDGFMDRGKYDITNLVDRSGKNVLAVLVHWVGFPVPNHASPTYISSAGWDWMPYVPGLLSGITDDVYLTTSRDITIEDPWIRSKVHSRDKAELSLQFDLRNNSTAKQEVQLKGTIQPGNIQFSEQIEIGGGQQKTFKFDSEKVEAFAMENPKLWWPNGYGEPNLHTMELTFMVDGQVSDMRTVTFGIREYGYEFVDGVFRILINGEPVFCKGGNWGMSEWLLRARGEEYDLKIKLHKEMNFNMIRNWIGSTTDEEFYQACDKYGIMVWDDFWLNSHKNLPDDVQAFNNNAIEKIKRLRNHACIAVWCGDNEGYPLEPLNTWLRGNVGHFDGGDRWYQANSNSDGLSGSGAWTNGTAAWYFTKYPVSWGDNMKRGWGFRTEIGTAVFTTFESFKKFMPEENWWPRDEMWDKHFFGKSASNASPDKYFTTVEENYGKASGIEDFCRKAQLVNIEVNKAMYEGWHHNIWDDATGILSWMSQSAYPSFVWQSYDYYYDLTGAYWGAKKACEPVHIQWSYADNSVKVVNTTLESFDGLRAKAKIYDLNGREIKSYGKEATLNVKANDATYAFHLQFIRGNKAFMKKAVASSVSKDEGDVSQITDGSDGSRWASIYDDNQWIYVDLGQKEEIGNIILKWEDAHAKSYKLQVSDDAENWTDIYANDDSKGGNEAISIKPVKAQYVRMLGLERATQWGYSLYEMEIYGREIPKSELTDVHFIKLELTDAKGHLISDNFYWRGNTLGDYTALNTLPKANLGVTHKLEKSGDKKIIRTKVKNNGKSVAFAVHVQPYRNSDGERILPAIWNDNYFTLLPGEQKEVVVEFDGALLPDDDFKVLVTPYNN